LDVGNARLWLVVPAYNEAGVIAGTLGELASFLPNVVVVDDGSRDDTSARAAEAGAVVLRHAVNLGQGAALQTGIEFALRNGATHVCTFDADGQHEAASVATLLERLVAANADVALGSRFLGRTIDMPPLRRAIVKAAVWLTRVQTGLPLTDTHNGLRLFTRAAAARIELAQPGMAHASEILALIAETKMRVIEVPTVVRYTDYSRRKGQSIANSFKIAFDLMYAAWSR
jgi:glycosyltransferase involved in cell wall biosynthesis